MPTTGLAPHGGKGRQRRVILVTSVVPGSARGDGGQAVGSFPTRQLLSSRGSPLEPTSTAAKGEWPFRLGAKGTSALQGPGTFKVA